jgi:streptogramin lyase
MNFYPPPPTLKATLYIRIPDHRRCTDQQTEWQSGFDKPFQHIFLEGPVADDLGNLYVTDIPFGRILRIDTSKNVSVVAQWDGEPNGLAATADGDLLIADYKQVGINPSVPSLRCADSSKNHRAYSNAIQVPAPSPQN